ncbi:hypothetical protein Rhow_005433 [Rhodococcus wratislaviensis]|uniref:Uncharacterized protein n=1 Tax=Rhodococcus wratislaviensis TaxID=44752 RepID=A0A402CDT9_RHOWR|nr:MULTISPECIES: hypothetical protein [Rhodococcus]GCE41774.1 hypothetical protein Rhow_005433 [Rhodococcus wratislaviensis]
MGARERTTTGSTALADAPPGRLPRRQPLPPRRPATSTSTSAGSRHGLPRRTTTTARPKRTDTRTEPVTKPTARKRPRDKGSRGPAHTGSSGAGRTRLPDPVAADFGDVTEWLKDQVGRLVDALRDRGEKEAQNLRQKFKKWLASLVHEVIHSNAGAGAGLEGIRAALTGKNPVWAAIKALMSGLSGKAKVGLVLLLLVALLLGPVLLVILLLALLVAVIVAAVRASSR